MRELSGKFFSRTTPQERNQYHKTIIDQIQSESEKSSEKVYLIATDYEPSSADAEELLKNESFDYDSLLTKLTDLAIVARNPRIQQVARKAVHRVINICFRRGYVINVMKYKIAAGIAAIIPLGDQLPRHLSRNAIRKAFGINDELCEYVERFDLTIERNDLKTSSFKKSVTTTTSENKRHANAEKIQTATRHTISLAGSLSDDVVRVAASSATALSTAGEVALAATTVAGIVFSGVEGYTKYVMYSATLWFELFIA
ncbi:unnamed protein product [Rotaria sp. Silwood1]|nr:unnamed protein product [Rotaria sp. Silwood1]